MSMNKRAAKKVEMPPLAQVGIVVRDVEKTMDFYTAAFGFGPWTIFDEIPNPGFKVKIAMAQSGQVQLELIQVLEGESLHSKFLKEKGEGLHHLAFFVVDIDKELARLTKLGITPYESAKVPGFDAGFAYLNTDKIGGVMFELLQGAHRLKDMASWREK
jgi:methylmalonyl-CoA/ethylmalonyl-CoA epimerase